MMGYAFSTENTTSNNLLEVHLLPAKEMKMEMPPVKKRKLKLPHENMFPVKNEPNWDLNSISSLDEKFKVDYDIEMDAETIIKLCK